MQREVRAYVTVDDEKFLEEVKDTIALGYE